MSFWGTIGKAAGWLDSNLGTTVFGKAAVTGSMWYGRNIAGTFVEDVGKELVSGFASQAVGGGQQAAGYEVPLPGASSPNFKSGVSPGKFSASQAKSLGWDNPKVKQAYAKAAQSNNPSIRAALETVRPTIGKRGPTKSLSEAQIGTRRS